MSYLRTHRLLNGFGRSDAVDRAAKLVTKFPKINCNLQICVSDLNIHNRLILDTGLGMIVTNKQKSHVNESHPHPVDILIETVSIPGNCGFSVELSHSHQLLVPSSC